MKKAFFFDRDGIVLEMVYHPEDGRITTVLTPSQVSFVPGIFELLKETKKQGFLNILVSNQPNIGLARMTLNNHESIKEKIERAFKSNDVVVDDQYYCFHHPFAKIKKYRMICDCRKPKSGLLLRAAKKHDIDLKKSWMIGDGVVDVVAGYNAGCKTILLANLQEAEYLRTMEERLEGIKPDYLVKKLPDVLSILRRNSKKK